MVYSIIQIINSYKNQYLNESKNFNEDSFKSLAEVIKSSSLLQQELEIYQNLTENKISNPTAAAKFIDNNLKKIEHYKPGEYYISHAKLHPFENNMNENNSLLNAIDQLIIETILKNTHSLNYITNYQNVLLNLNENDENIIDDEIISIAESIVNDECSKLNEEEKMLSEILSLDSKESNEEIFESLRNDCKTLVNDLKIINEQGELTKKKLNEMKFENSIDQILKLHELYKNLKGE